MGSQLTNAAMAAGEDMVLADLRLSVGAQVRGNV
jgi:hypothetical protein